MLSFPLKHTTQVDLQHSLHRFVESAYSKAQAEEHRDAFSSAQSLRERVRNASLVEKTASDTVALLARYYRLASALRSRFGSALDESDAPLQFTWKDAFKHNDKCSHDDVQVPKLRGWPMQKYSSPCCS